MYELVIFECDGVFVDSEAISNEMIARMLTREGPPTTLREAVIFCVLGAGYRVLTNEAGPPFDLRRLQGRGAVSA